MIRTIRDCQLELVQGDVTDQDVDAIVNAANSRLAGGGGVVGAIHRRGGPTIMEETIRRYPSGCPTGSSVESSAGRLAATHVFHAVGPVWKGGNSGEADLLSSAYRQSLQLCIDHNCKSIAFPALSTGAYRYPIQQAAQVALATTVEFLKEHDAPGLVRFVLFDDVSLTEFEAVLSSMN